MAAGQQTESDFIRFGESFCYKKLRYKNNLLMIFTVFFFFGSNPCQKFDSHFVHL